MNRMMTAIALLCLSLPVMAQAAEFQPIGALGMGGAGVARNNGALTAYWNPAGGAFNDTPFAMHLGAGVGVRGSDGLAENIDRLSGIDFDNIKNFDSTQGATAVGDMVKTITVLDDIGKRNGNIALNAQVPIGFAIKHVSFGVYGNLEGSIVPKADIKNILSENVSSSSTTSTTSIADLYNAISGSTYTPTGYFSNEQLQGIADLFTSKSAGAITNTQGQQLAYAIDNQLAASGIPASTSYDSLTATLIPTLASSGTTANTFDKNTTSAMTKAIRYYEVPLSYGHPFDLGKYGKLGIGATAKVISGTVYQNQVLLVNRPGGENIDSGDLVDDMTENSKSSVTFGVDLGALYKYDKWLSVGLVAKNLNSPKFDGPEYYVPEENNPALKEKRPGEEVKLKPQVRFGVAMDPYSWLTIASDLDLTENETVAPGSVVGSSDKSRNLGAGVEIHPYSWLKIRGGAYKNLAASDIGLVLTGGFTLFVLDVDGAFATDKFKIDNTSVPQEARVQVSMSFAF